MRLVPIAFESLGVRSQATLIETKDCRILIDPAVSLAPRRYGLPPHQLEVDSLNSLSRRIEEEAKNVDVIIITHYHYDHHDSGYVVNREIYRGKKVFVKDPENFINRSQRNFRAPKFLKSIQGLPSSIEAADSKEFRVGSTSVKFSHPVPHGNDERLGYVVQVAVSDRDQTVLFTSDIEGAPREQHLDFTLSVNPNLIVLDGPLSYLLGRAWSEETLSEAVRNMERVMRSGLDTVIIDHHVLRDLNYERVLSPVIEIARGTGVKVITAAQYLGLEVQNLEARRRELFKLDNRPGKLTKRMLDLMGEDR